MNILVTGGNSFIARSIVPMLKNNQFNVFFPKHIELNICNLSSVKNFICNNKIDIIIHTATKGSRKFKYKSTSNDFYENILMVENLLFLRKNYDKLIIFGSGAEYDQRYNIDFVKEGKYTSIPIDYYALSKFVISNRVKNKNVINLRLFNIFGPLETDRLIHLALQCYINKKTFQIFRDDFIDFFYIDDLYKIIKYSIDNLKNEEINCCYNKKYSISEILKIINDFSYYKIDIIIDNKHGKYYTGDYSKLYSYNLPFGGLVNGIKKNYKFLMKNLL